MWVTWWWVRWGWEKGGGRVNTIQIYWWMAPRRRVFSWRRYISCLPGIPWVDAAHECGVEGRAPPPLPKCSAASAPDQSAERSPGRSYTQIINFNFFGFFLFMYDIQHCFICRPSDSTVSEDAGIEPRTVATTALAVGRSNHSARSHPQ